MPARRRMTRFASLLKAAFVWVSVATGALRELQSRELQRRSFSRHRSVTLLASHLLVRTRQSETSERVIKTLVSLPIRGVVTFLACIPKLPFVRIFVTGRAIGWQSEEGSIQVLDGNRRALRFLNMLRVVALGTVKTNMFSSQSEPRLAVVKLRQTWLPPYHLEVFAVVFGVTAYAGLTVVSGFHDRRVESAIRVQPLGDFLMAIKTAKIRGSRGDCVTRCTSGRTVQ